MHYCKYCTRVWFYMTLASSTLRSEEPRRRGGMMWWKRSEEAAAEARKAEGASCTALRIPSPPIFTGRVACAHAGSSSVKCIFVIRPMNAWRSLSYSCNTGERSEVLRLYRSFGRAKVCLTRRIASWAESCSSLSPILFSMPIFIVRTSEMEWTSPIDDPKWVAFVGSTII